MHLKVEIKELLMYVHVHVRTYVCVNIPGGQGTGWGSRWYTDGSRWVWLSGVPCESQSCPHWGEDEWSHSHWEPTYSA